MEKVSVPIRKVTSYQSDDGRRVEIYEKVYAVDTEFEDEVKATLQFPEEDVVYLGAMQVSINNAVQDLKFQIHDASSVEDAFNKFNVIAPTVVDQIHKQMRDEQMDNRIVQASDLDLGVIDQASEGGIITP